MAVDYNRQYIGARYVPKFFENPNGTWEWAGGFQYEPLTIVKYGTNTYTSKKLVPSNIGAPNTVPEYWAQTGDYNGAIVSLQEDVYSLENIVSNLENFTSVKSLNILLIGDSYGTNYGTTSNWFSVLKERLENLGSVVQGNPIAGAAWIVGENYGTSTYASQYNAAENKSELNYILIAGGINDRYITDCYNPAKLLMDSIKINSPKAKVVFVNIGNTTRMQEQSIYFYNMKNRYFQLLAAGIEVAGNGWQILRLGNYMQEDKIHPNTDAATILASYIFGVIQGLETIPPISGIDTAKNCFYCIVNGNVTLMLGNPFANLPDEFTFNTEYDFWNGNPPFFFSPTTNFGDIIKKVGYRATTTSGGTVDGTITFKLSSTGLKYKININMEVSQIQSMTYIDERPIFNYGLNIF